MKNRQKIHLKITAIFLYLTAFLVHGTGLRIFLYGNYNKEYWLAILLIVASYFIAKTGATISRNYKRINQPTMDELLASDTRPPVLLLRNFIRDQQKIDHVFKISSLFFFSKNSLNSLSSYSTFEEQIVEIFTKIGPVVSLGDPNDSLQPLGASRAYCLDNNWQEKVKEIALKSSLVVFIIDDTPALRWELDWIHRNIDMNKIILLSPPLELIKPSNRWHISWLELRKQFTFLPTIKEGVIGVKFNRDHQPNIASIQSENMYDQLRAIEKLIYYDEYGLLIAEY